MYTEKCACFCATVFDEETRKVTSIMVRDGTWKGSSGSEARAGAWKSIQYGPMSLQRIMLIQVMRTILTCFSSLLIFHLHQLELSPTVSINTTAWRALGASRRRCRRGRTGWTSVGDLLQLRTPYFPLLNHFLPSCTSSPAWSALNNATARLSRVHAQVPELTEDIKGVAYQHSLTCYAATHCASPLAPADLLFDLNDSRSCVDAFFSASTAYLYASTLLSSDAHSTVSDDRHNRILTALDERRDKLDREGVMLWNRSSSLRHLMSDRTAASETSPESNREYTLLSAQVIATSKSHDSRQALLHVHNRLISLCLFT